MGEKKLLKKLKQPPSRKNWPKKRTEKAKEQGSEKKDKEQLISIDEWKSEQNESLSQQIEEESQTLEKEVLYDKGLTTFKPISNNKLAKVKNLERRSLHPKASAQLKEKNLENPFNYSEIKAIEAKKYQLLQNKKKNQANYPISDSSSPLQMHIIQSENLRIAQEKLIELEQELYKTRKKNTELVSASEVLKNKNEKLESEMEEFKFSIQEKKDSFKEEKEVLLSTLEEAKAQIIQLRSSEDKLKKQLLGDFQNVRARENTLESRLEILKMESSVLQLEKDKTIIELKNQTQKLKLRMDEVYKKNRDLQTENNELRESSRRVVSALRATIFSLEGGDTEWDKEKQNLIENEEKEETEK